MTTTLVRTMTDEEKRTRAAILCLQGHTQEEIGARLGVAQNTVSVWLSGLRDEWVKNAARDRIERIAEGLAKLDLAEVAAWAAGDLRAVLKCIDIRFRVLGAYNFKLTVTSRPPLDWDAIASPAQEPDPVETRLARYQENGHAD